MWALGNEAECRAPAWVICTIKQNRGARVRTDETIGVRCRRTGLWRGSGPFHDGRFDAWQQGVSPCEGIGNLYGHSNVGQGGIINLSRGRAGSSSIGCQSLIQ